MFEYSCISFTHFCVMMHLVAVDLFVFAPFVFVHLAFMRMTEFILFHHLVLITYNLNVNIVYFVLPKKHIGYKEHTNYHLLKICENPYSGCLICDDVSRGPSLPVSLLIDQNEVLLIQ